jgi:hypothetical protein
LLRKIQPESETCNGNQRKGQLYKNVCRHANGGWVYSRDLEKNEDTLIEVPKEQVMNISQSTAQILIPWRGAFFKYKEDPLNSNLQARNGWTQECFKVKFIGKKITAATILSMPKHIRF